MARKKVEPLITDEQREKLKHIHSLVAQAESIAGSLTPEQVVTPSDRAERAGIEAMWSLDHRLCDLTHYFADLAGIAMPE